MCRSIVMWILAIVFACGLFLYSNIAGMFGGQNTTSAQWISVVLFLGLIVYGIREFFKASDQGAAVIAKENAEKQNNSRWDGPESPAFEEACDEAGLNQCERKMFYSVARIDYCWGRYGETVAYAKEWKQGYGPMLKQHCPDE